MSASVRSFPPKAQGHRKPEATDYDIIPLKHITRATELRLLRSRGGLRFGRFSRTSRITGSGSQMVCVASLLEKSCLGLDPGYLEREEVKALVGTCEQRVAWSLQDPGGEKWPGRWRKGQQLR